MRRIFHRNRAPATSTVAPSVTTTTVVSESAPVAAYSESTIQQVELPKELREKPAVVHENIRREEVEEIQPVIHREREVTELRQLTQPIYEQDVRPIQIHEQILAAEQRPAIIGAVAVTQPAPLSTSQFAGVERKIVEKPAVIVETIRRHVIEEIQPIIYKEIHEPHIIRVTKPIYERIVETPVVTQQILAARNYTVQLPQQEVVTTTTTTATEPGVSASNTGYSRRGFHGHHHHEKNHPTMTTQTAGAPTTVVTTGPNTTVTSV